MAQSDDLHLRAVIEFVAKQDLTVIMDHVVLARLRRAVRRFRTLADCEVVSRILHMRNKSMAHFSRPNEPLNNGELPNYPVAMVSLRELMRVTSATARIWAGLASHRMLEVKGDYYYADPHDELRASVREHSDSAKALWGAWQGASCTK